MTEVKPAKKSYTPKQYKALETKLHEVEEKLKSTYKELEGHRKELKSVVYAAGGRVEVPLELQSSPDPIGYFAIDRTHWDKTVYVAESNTEVEAKKKAEIDSQKNSYSAFLEGIAIPYAKVQPAKKASKKVSKKASSIKYPKADLFISKTGPGLSITWLDETHEMIQEPVSEL